MGSLRTQVYLTRDQRRKLDARARSEAKTLASVIRDAVDAYTAEEPKEVEQAIASTFGSLPDLEVPRRSEWDRGVG
jgi:hypothetical protein